MLWIFRCSWIKVDEWRHKIQLNQTERWLTRVEKPETGMFVLEKYDYKNYTTKNKYTWLQAAVDMGSRGRWPDEKCMKFKNWRGILVHFGNEQHQNIRKKFFVICNKDINLNLVYLQNYPGIKLLHTHTPPPHGDIPVWVPWMSMRNIPWILNDHLNPNRDNDSV